MFHRNRHSDRGMTLPELLISVSLMGLLATVLAGAMSVTLRQAKSTEGRANLARSESSIDTWLPADLASTDVLNTTLPAVNLDPAATPCGNCAGIDMTGTNALQLAWDTAGRVTRVQYQYIEFDGDWQLRRISCVGTDQCKVITVLRGLEAPTDLGYLPKTVRPTWVLNVNDPTSAADLELDDNAKQIVVTIDGGSGGTTGASGGENRISLTAGGRTTEQIDPDDFTVPSFVRAKSRCGGPVTLIVDDSGSIGNTNLNSVVKPGVAAFIEAFRGTPTQLQIIQFSSLARAIGPNIAATSADPGTSKNGGWHRYIDMTNDQQVNDLKTAVASSLVADGGTNWEEAFFHTFKEMDGTPAATLPNRIVFFTDGIPTVSRRTADGFASVPTFHNGPVIDFNNGEYNRSTGWPAYNGTLFHQESYDRADVILDGNRNIDKIFVGVGAGLQTNSNWTYNASTYANRNAPPNTAVQKKGSEILANLLMDGPSGQVPAVFENGKYTNPETADFYEQSSFDSAAFAEAMRAAALKDCGGTLTVQTRLDTGAPVQQEFVFENTSFRDSSGNKISTKPRRVTTSKNFRTGTFDFEISGGSNFFSVDVVPSELQTLGGFTAPATSSAGWSCRAGASSKPTIPIPITGSAFKGFTVDVLANEAVSCILTVSQ